MVRALRRLSWDSAAAVRSPMRVLASLLLLFSAAAAGEDAVLRFYGYAYDLHSGAYAYTEVHEQQVVDGEWLGGSTRFYLPDGQLFGHKTLDFRQDPFVPLMQLTLTRPEYYEAIAPAQDALRMELRSGPKRPLQQRRFDKPEACVADSGLHAYVRANFQTLMQGQTLRFRFAVPSDLAVFKFRIRRIDDTRFEGRPAVRFRVEPDSLLRWIADPMELTYQVEDMKVLEYRGTTNLRDPRSGRQYDVRISYASQPPADAPPLPPLP